MATLEELAQQEFGKAKPQYSNFEDRVRAEFAKEGVSLAPTPSQVVPAEELGPPGLAESSARFGIAEARTFNEKLNAFKRVFREGELVVTNISYPHRLAEGQREISPERVLLFRKSPTERFAKVDADLLEKNEPLNDLIDFMGGEVGSLIGQAVAVLPAGRSISLLPLMARQFGGAAIGEVGQQAVQTARGIQEETPTEILSGGALKGAAAAGGVFAATPLTKFWNAITGGGYLKLKRGAPEAILATERLGVAAPIAPQLAQAPILQRAARQSAATSGHIMRYVEQQQQDAVLAIEKLRVRGTVDLAGGLETAERAERGNILKSIMLPRRIEATEAGQQIQKLVDEWDVLARTNITQLYNRARSVEKPVFNLSPAQEVAHQIERGVVSRTPGAPPTISYETAFGERVPVFKSVGTPPGQLRVSGVHGDPVQAEVLDVVATIKQMDPKVSELAVGGRTIHAVDQLNALRKRLFDAKTPALGEVIREPHAIAQQLYKAISDVIDNPVNKSPAFVAGWKKATSAAHQRFATLEMASVRQILAGEKRQALELANRFIAPNQAENLALLKSMGMNREYAYVKARFKTQLLDDASNIVRTLDKFDRPTLTMLMSGSEEQAFRQAGTLIEKLESSGIRQALARQTERGAIVRDALNTSDTAKLAEISRIINRAGGLDSPTGQSFRAGFIDNIIEDVTRYDKAGRVIDFNKLNTTIESLQKRGLFRFLTQSDIQHLKDQRIVAEMVKQIEDAGSSIQASEQAANLVYRTSVKALYHMARLMGFGRLIIMKPINTFLIGAGKSQSLLIPLKTASGMMTSTLINLEQDERRSAFAEK